MTVAEPYNGCSELSNGEIVAGRIALLQRGQCMFAEKARHIQKAGAIGGIVIGETCFIVKSPSSEVLIFFMSMSPKFNDFITKNSPAKQT